VPTPVTRSSRCGVCELSKVRILGKATCASTPSEGAHTQPSPRASRGGAGGRHPTPPTLPSVPKPASSFRAATGNLSFPEDVVGEEKRRERRTQRRNGVRTAGR